MAHIIATAAIVIDARAAHELIDDRRMTPSLYAKLEKIAELKNGWLKTA